jgi:hypothetical protein
MKWLVFFVMTIAEPFAVKTIKFETKNECVDYVNDPSNANTLAIEVIAVAGFNDNIIAVTCLPENEVREKLNETESKI